MTKDELDAIRERDARIAKIPSHQLSSQVEEDRRALLAHVDALEARLAEAELKIASWLHDGRLQTFEDRERVRGEMRAFLRPAANYPELSVGHKTADSAPAVPCSDHRPTKLVCGKCGGDFTGVLE